MYGHIAKLAEAEKAGIEAAGGSADVYQLVPPPISFSSGMKWSPGTFPMPSDRTKHH